MIRYLSLLSIVSVCFFGMTAQAASLDKYDEIGLSSYSIDGDVWQDLSRQDVYNFTSGLPDEPRTFLVRHIARNILLSATDVSDLDERQDNAPTLAQVRIKKLMAMGDYNLALELITAKGKNFPDAQHYELYTRLLILTGQSPVACVEVNIASKKFPEHEGLKDIKTYCQYRYTEAKLDENEGGLKNIKDPIVRKAVIDKDHSLKLTVTSEISDLPPYRLAVLASMGQIDLSKFKRGNYKFLPSSHIVPLLRSAKLSDGDRSTLLLIAVDRGVVTADKLFDFYVKFFEAEDSLEINNEWPDHKRIAALFRKWDMTDDIKDKQSVAGALFNLAESHTGLLQAFASKVSDRDVGNDVFLDHWKELLPILSIQNPSIARRLLRLRSEQLEEDFDKVDDAKDQKHSFFTRHIDFFALALVYDQLPSNLRNNYVKYLSDQQSDTKSFKESSDLYIKIVSALDKGVSFDDNPASIYEKHKAHSAPQYVQYSMPNTSQWQIMARATDNNESGLFVFSSLELMQRQKEQDMYPLLLSDVIEGYMNVGNKEMARQIATLAIVGH